MQVCEKIFFFVEVLKIHLLSVPFQEGRNDDWILAAFFGTQREPEKSKNINAPIFKLKKTKAKGNL